MGYKLQKIYVGSQQVRPSGWKPGANTLAYYPLTSSSTVNDMSGNSKNLTNNGSVTFGNVGGVNCATFSGSNYLNRSESLFTGSATFTVNFWMRRTGEAPDHGNILSIGTAYSTNSFVAWIFYDSPYNLRVGGWSNDLDTGYPATQNAWLNVVYAHSGGTIKVYVNGNLEYTGSVNFNVQPGFTGVGCGVNNDSYFIGNMSAVIVESAAWSDQEVSDYYNLTKSNYGL